MLRLNGRGITSLHLLQRLLTAARSRLLRSDAAREAAQAVVTAATGASTVDEATKIAPGRPPVGGAGPSPVIHTRVTRAMKQRLAATAEREQRRESDVVRDALAAYLDSKSVA